MQYYTCGWRIANVADKSSDGPLVFKDFLVLVPVFGTLLAALYEVGYFYGVGISYFTLFSLSEHIVFALTALPFALVLALTFPTGYISYRMGYVTAAKATPPIPPAPISNEEVTKFRATLNAYQKRVLNRLMAFGALGLIMSLGALWLKLYIMAAICGCLGVVAVLHAGFSEVVSADKALLTGYFFAALLVAFVSGLEAAKWIDQTTKASSVVRMADGELAGLILRSGERGLLFYDTDQKRLAFLLWPDIKRILAK